MEKQLYENILNVINREGGYVVDTGGATNYGVTIPAYQEFTKSKITEGDIKNLTIDDAFLFYKWLFKKYKLDGLKHHQVVDLLFDSIVNHGAAQAVCWAQRGKGIACDGIIGSITTDAINRSPKTTYYNILRYRVEFYAFLVSRNSDKYLKYLNGWMKRAGKFIEGFEE